MFPVFSDLYAYAGGWPLGTVIKSQNIIVTATYMHIYVCIYTLFWSKGMFLQSIYFVYLCIELKI